MKSAGQPSTPQSKDWQRPFPLLKYFSIGSLVFILIAAIVLGIVYRNHAVGELMAQAERRSNAFARLVSFTLHTEISSLLKQSGDEVSTERVIGRIDNITREQAAFFNAAKIKIYSRNGVTVFSSVKKEIGRNQADNQGVIGALQGRTLSSIAYRERFNTFDNVIENRDLYQTYLPVTDKESGEIIGVFELYSDLTPLLAHIQNTERLVIASVVGLLLVLYTGLFAIVYRAHRIILVQDQTLKAHVHEIQRDNVELEDRVRERTEALEMAIQQLKKEISERESAQQALEEARLRGWEQDKLAAIGRLAAGIVHEIGNPLAALDGLVKKFDEDMSGQPPQEVEDTLQSIRENINRLAVITHDVSEFAVPASLEPELVNLNEVVSRVVNVLQYDDKFREVKMELELDHDLPAVSVIPDQLMQVVMNLILNALDAIEKKPGANRTITVKTNGQDGKAELTVEDQGEGMHPEIQAKAFEPFQTTKAPGEGLGIGLSLCYSIVRENGGKIDIDSQPQVGTAVSVTLPVPELRPS